MHNLDPDFDNVNKYHAALKKDESQQDRTFVVNLNKPYVMSQEELKQRITSKETE